MTLLSSVSLCEAFTTKVAFLANNIPIGSFYNNNNNNNNKKSISLCAKKRKTKPSYESDDFSSWYDEVDSNASPDDVFWEEMDRQRLLSQIGTSSSAPSPSSSSLTAAAAAAPMREEDDVWDEDKPKRLSDDERKTYDKILTSYSAHMVPDNWLDERYIEMDEAFRDWADSDDDGDDLEKENRILNEQINELLNESEAPKDNKWDFSDEPWDHYDALHNKVTEDGDEEDRFKFDPSKASEFLLEDEESPESYAQSLAEEADYTQSLSTIQIHSPRLTNAAQNPKSKAYFSRPPDTNEGCDTMWASAIDTPCINNLVGVFHNYGVQFADNFGDWMNGCEADKFRTIEDIASYKARLVYNVTGLPCIASRTSFEVEPIRTSMTTTNPLPVTAPNNPRVTSGYRFNDITDDVEYILEALKPQSDPTRVTRFKSCLCFYDGQMEVYDYGTCDVDIYYSNTLRTYIPMDSAIHEMCSTLQLSLGLVFQKWLKEQIQESALVPGSGQASSSLKSKFKASIKLRDRVLKDGRVLMNDIIDVSGFMDSCVDVNLMDECGDELSQRFMNHKPNKILTVATTGLVIAIPMAKYLQVPVVYARKERSIVMADTFTASYSSKTVGQKRELLVSKNHITPEDRILIIDDFLSSGSSQEALLRIVSDAGAETVGIGVLLEKVYESGRKALSGYDVPVESLVRVASVSDGVMTLVEEEGFDDEEIRKK